MKLTLPRAIIISSLMLALAITFRHGGINAEVAGMDWYDLEYDYDFKRAVEEIIEDCYITGHVEDDYLYSSSISC